MVATQLSLSSYGPTNHRGHFQRWRLSEHDRSSSRVKCFMEDDNRAHLIRSIFVSVLGVAVRTCNAGRWLGFYFRRAACLPWCVCCWIYRENTVVMRRNLHSRWVVTRSVWLINLLYATRQVSEIVVGIRACTARFLWWGYISCFFLTFPLSHKSGV